MSAKISKTTLDNGLTVILNEMHHAPVASFWVWYRVGSRNERSGLTGVSHWVEHMMFKGSEAFPAGSLDGAISREGGRWNAFTWLDFTAYFETMPSDRIGLALAIESDRMANAAITPADVESERTVIISERGMYENQPMFQLNEEMSAAAFRVHPYHHEVIGDEADLRSMTRDDLYNHYRRYYAPNNAVVVVAGDFKTEAMLALVKEKFGSIPAGDPIPAVTRAEPRQRGERRVTVQGPGDTHYVVYSYRAPAASDPDFHVLALLNAAFTGGSSLGLFGSTTTNKSSRLYRALVDSGLAAGVFGSLAPTIDPYLYSIGAVVRAGQSVTDVMTAMDAEIARLGSARITQSELDKAMKRARVELISASQSVSGQGQMLGYSEIVARDHEWFDKALARMDAISLADLERVRVAYLRPSVRTVGIYEPTTNGSAGQ